MKIKIMNVRLAFPELWEAVPFSEGDKYKRFGCALLVPKDHPQRGEIQQAILAAGVEKYGPKFKDPAFRKTVKIHAWRDGDEKEYEGYPGNFYISANRNEKKGRPRIVDRDNTPLTPADGRPYGGCFVNAVIEFYGHTTHGKTLNCSLLGLQFERNGESFSGGASASESDFDDLGPDPDADASSWGGDVADTTPKVATSDLGGDFEDDDDDLLG